MLDVGQKAPPFTLTDADGRQVSLEELGSERVLLWFFPKASTPG